VFSLRVLPSLRSALGRAARPGLGPVQRFEAAVTGVVRLIRREHRQLLWLTSIALFITR
jgi:hypothetical protein